MAPSASKKLKAKKLKAKKSKAKDTSSGHANTSSGHADASSMASPTSQPPKDSSPGPDEVLAQWDANWLALENRIAENGRDIDAMSRGAPADQKHIDEMFATAHDLRKQMNEATQQLQDYLVARGEWSLAAECAEGRSDMNMRQ